MYAYKLNVHTFIGFTSLCMQCKQNDEYSIHKQEKCVYIYIVFQNQQLMNGDETRY